MGICILFTGCECNQDASGLACPARALTFGSKVVSARYNKPFNKVDVEYCLLDSDTRDTYLTKYSTHWICYNVKPTFFVVL